MARKLSPCDAKIVPSSKTDILYSATILALYYKKYSSIAAFAIYNDRMGLRGVPDDLIWSVTKHTRENIRPRPDLMELEKNPYDLLYAEENRISHICMITFA